MFENFLLENDLIVVNGLEICEGKITRFQETVNRTEQSIIDFFVICRRFLPFVNKMVVDEERKHVLTKFCTKRGVKSIKESDHNTLILELNQK